MILLIHETKETFWHLFKGNVTNAEFFFSYFLFLLGVTIYTIGRVINRRNQDIEPSFKIWIEHKNNKLELVLSILFMYVQVRFAEGYQDWLLKKLPDGFTLIPYFIMVISGVAQHYIIVQFLKFVKKVE